MIDCSFLHFTELHLNEDRETLKLAIRTTRSNELHTDTARLSQLVPFFNFSFFQQMGRGACTFALFQHMNTFSTPPNCDNTVHYSLVLKGFCLRHYMEKVFPISPVWVIFRDNFY